jgi:hypothetical protein
MSPLAPAALALALVHLVACGPAPAPTPEAAPIPAAAPAPAPKVAATPDTVRTINDRAGLIPMTEGPRPAPEPPLTQEELDLLAADPATLSLEMRRKRGYALRRKILQNPDSPAARQLEAMRLAMERGEIKPQLPPGGSGLVLHTSAPPTSKTPAPTPASTPTPAPAPTP